MAFLLYRHYRHGRSEVALKAPEAEWSQTSAVTFRSPRATWEGKAVPGPVIQGLLVRSSPANITTFCHRMGILTCLHNTFRRSPSDRPQRVLWTTNRPEACLEPLAFPLSPACLVCLIHWYCYGPITACLINCSAVTKSFNRFWR